MSTSAQRISGMMAFSMPPSLATFVETEYGNAVSPVVSVKNFGARGDGIHDDTVSIQAALSSITGGGGCFLPAGDYLVTAGLRPLAGTTIYGDGYGSRILCSAAGWLLGATSNMGLVNVNGKDGVRVTGLRLYGTKSSDQTHTPKLIYFETVNGLSIDHCWLEHSEFEGIWNGGTQANNPGVIIDSNHVSDVGYPAAAFGGLPAIQLNCEEAVISNNRLYDVGVGIGISGARISVTGNFVREFRVAGISTGDSGESGVISITGNVIQFSADATVPRKGIQLDSGNSNKRIVNVVGNTVRILGGLGLNVPRGISHNNVGFSSIVGNAIEIDVQGIGIGLLGSIAGEFSMVSDNTIRFTNEGAAASYGISGIPNGGGKTLTVRTSNNKVFGLTRANGSFGYDFNASGGGTLDVVMAGDVTSEGNVRCVAYYGAGECDNRAIFMGSADHPMFMRFPQLASVAFADLGTPPNGVFQYVSDGTPGNPLTGSGTGCLAFRQAGVWVGLS